MLDSSDHQARASTSGGDPQGSDDGARRLAADAVSVLASARAALHPRRLLIALLLLLLLGQLGRTIDSMSAPRFGPQGVLAVDPAADLAAALSRLETLLGGATPAADAAEESAAAITTPRAARRAVTVAIDTRVLAWRASQTPEQRQELLAGLVEIEGLRPRGTYESIEAVATQRIGDLCRAALTLQASAAAAALGDLAALPIALWRHDRGFLLWFGVPAVLLVATFGGMLARIAAVRFARGQWISASESADFAAASIARLVGVALLPPLVALLPLALAGVWALAMGVAPLAVPLGVAFGGSLLLTLLAALLLLGAVAGLPLLLPAVACEEVDAADCLQRAYAYAVHRAARYLLLLVVAAAGALVGTAVVDGIAVATLALAAAVAATAGPEWLGLAVGAPRWLVFGEPVASAAAWLEVPWSANAVAVWATLLRMFVGAFLVAWWFDAGVRIYLLLRRVCDGQQPDEIADSPGRPPRVERIREAIAAASRR
jgi:hypothetical protein